MLFFSVDTLNDFVKVLFFSVDTLNDFVKVLFFSVDTLNDFVKVLFFSVDTLNGLWLKLMVFQLVTSVKLSTGSTRLLNMIHQNLLATFQ